jgi:transposase
MELFWLSDRQWQRIEPLLPKVHTGPVRVDDRRVISGILFVLREGCRWRALPDAYGPRTTVYNRFNRWSKRGCGRSCSPSWSRPAPHPISP